MDDLLDYSQAADAYNIKRGTLAWLVHRGLIPHIRLGPRFVRFRRSEVETWLRQRELTASDLGSKDSEEQEVRE